MKRVGQGGQVLLELVIIAAVSLLLAVWGAGYWAQEAEDQAVRAMGQWVDQIQRALHHAVTTSDALPFGNGLGDEQPALKDWITWLKQEGYLPEPFVNVPPLPYRLGVERLSLPRLVHGQLGQLTNEQATTLVMIVLTPPNDWSASLRQDRSLGIASVLPGRSLIVSDLSPSHMQGASFRLSNPLPGRRAWVSGTVGVVAWRSDLPPPYVRLEEPRHVHLGGGLAVDGDHVVRGLISATEGLLVGGAGAIGSVCQPEGLVRTSPQGGLAICREGRWEAVGESSGRLIACKSRPALVSYVDEVRQMAPFGDPDTRICDCAHGYLPRFIGPGLDTVSGLPVTEGYLCEKY
jgi:hypothetical protein